MSFLPFLVTFHHQIRHFARLNDALISFPALYCHSKRVINHKDTQKHIYMSALENSYMDAFYLVLSSNSK